MKNISKKTISVMDDILNSALTLFLPLKFIIMRSLSKSKSQQHWLPFDVRFYLFLQLGDCIQHKQ
jgi:hypothetical protein